jgi:hypothetical protein
VKAVGFLRIQRCKGLIRGTMISTNQNIASLPCVTQKRTAKPHLCRV